MRAVDVNDVQRDRDPSGATNLGDELIRNQMRRHLIEDPRDFERQGMIAAEPAGSLKRQRGNRPETGTRRPISLGIPFLQGAAEYVPRGEVAIEGRPADPGSRRDLRHARLAIPSKRRGCLEDPAAALGGVSAHDWSLMSARRRAVFLATHADRPDGDAVGRL
jgi:hypothetical protein